MGRMVERGAGDVTGVVHNSSCCSVVLMVHRPCGRSWVRCLPYGHHGTRLTRAGVRYTTRLARTGEIVTKPRSGRRRRDVAGGGVAGRGTAPARGPDVPRRGARPHTARARPRRSGTGPSMLLRCRPEDDGVVAQS